MRSAETIQIIIKRIINSKFTILIVRINFIALKIDVLLKNIIKVAIQN